MRFAEQTGRYIKSKNVTSPVVTRPQRGQRRAAWLSFARCNVTMAIILSWNWIYSGSMKRWSRPRPGRPSKCGASTTSVAAWRTISKKVRTALPFIISQRSPLPPIHLKTSGIVSKAPSMASDGEGEVVGFIRHSLSESMISHPCCGILC